jgi:hypothetical protein
MFFMMATTMSKPTEHGGSMFLRNVGNLPSEYVLLHPRRHHHHCENLTCHKIMFSQSLFATIRLV